MEQTPGQTATGGVVDAIDAAVEGLCGCGCKTKLSLNGPSAYFASPECQSRWNDATQVDNPTEVYHRDDAFIAPFPGRAARERRPPTITCPRCGSTSHHPVDFDEGWCANCRSYTSPRSQDRRESEVPIPDNWIATPAGTIRAIGYRHFCRTCERFRHPEPLENIDIRAIGNPDHRHPGGRGCRRCSTPFPYTAQLVHRVNPSRIHFVVESCNEAAGRDIDALELMQVEDIRTFADRTWQQLERELERRRRDRDPTYRQWLNQYRVYDPRTVINYTIT